MFRNMLISNIIHEISFTILVKFYSQDQASKKAPFHIQP